MFLELVNSIVANGNKSLNQSQIYNNSMKLISDKFEEKQIEINNETNISEKQKMSNRLALGIIDFYYIISLVKTTKRFIF